jgi:hypothetical protein
MKRCPTCQKTFDDVLRFCQADGTPLVDDAPPPDPYKTMVASREDIQAALNAPAAAPEPAQQNNSIRREDEPLEIPSAPVSQPTPASEFETKLAGREEAQVIEIPPLTDSTPPEPPRFNEPSAPPPSFGDKSTPASPFASPPSGGAGDFPTTPPIPSPFSGSPKPASFEPPAAPVSEPEPEQEERTYFEPEPAAPSYSEPEPTPVTPQYAEPEPAPAQQFNPFQGQSSPQNAPIAQTEWTPPPTPGQGGQGMAPPAAAGAKLNQTLPIVSLVFGILSICCYVSPLTGLIALITGFLGIKNVKNDSRQYGGKTLAIIGMILGGLMFLVGIAYWIFILFLGGANILLQLLNR